MVRLWALLVIVPGRLATSTYRSYELNVPRHILPALGRIVLRQLRPHHIDALYDRLLTPSVQRPALAPKTVYEIHLVIRGSLADAVRRGLPTRDVALLARSPSSRRSQKTEAQSWTDARSISGARLVRPRGRKDAGGPAKSVDKPLTISLCRYRLNRTALSGLTATNTRSAGRARALTLAVRFNEFRRTPRRSGTTGGSAPGPRPAASFVRGGRTQSRQLTCWVTSGVSAT